MKNPDHNTQSFAMSRTRGSTHGFTLFEVLGAVALLAIVYTMLSTAAIRGLQTEGRSRRILEASIIADLEIANLELELDQGAMRPLGDEETESDDGLYRIWSEVTVFEMPELENAAFPSGDSGQPGAAGLLAPFGTTGESLLRMITVQVSWGEPDDERFVERVTYGIEQSEIPDELPR
jgi:hypothetical protein